MNEMQAQDHTPPAVETTDQTRKAWVAPQWERIPLNEAQAGGPPFASGNDARVGYS